MELSRETVNRLKSEYPSGTRVRCIYMNDPFHPIDEGTTGTVDHVDDAGQLHMHWDNGRTLALVYGEDIFEKISSKPKLKGVER